LLEKGADVNVKDNNNKTALDYAKSGGNEEIVNLLLSELLTGRN
jgi:ankyrin repeat protein